MKSAAKAIRDGCTAWISYIRHMPATAAVMEAEAGSYHQDVHPRGRWESLCDAYTDVFATPGAAPDRRVKHRIELVPGATPPSRRMYRMTPTELVEVRRQLDEYIERGWIRPSSSPFGAPLIFIRKKDGSLRMVIDYRQLNAITQVDKYPIPRIDDLFDRLLQASVMSSMDLYHGYHQVPMEPGHEYKTAFVTRYGSYEWTVLPLGLCNAPSTFQRLMHEVLGDALDRFL